MRRPKRIEEKRGLQSLREDIELFALATKPEGRIEAFTRVMRRYRAVLARACGIPSSSQQLEKDIYLSLQLIANRAVWMEMWRIERTLLKGTKPAQTAVILGKMPMYLAEMRRVYPLVCHYVAAQKTRAQTQRALLNPSTAHTEPRDPGRRGPRIDLTIEQINEASIDREERSLSLRIGWIELSDAKKLKEALIALPCVNAVQMKGIQGWRREAKYSIRTTLTTEALARTLANGLRGMVFRIAALNERTIEVTER